MFSKIFQIAAAKELQVHTYSEIYELEGHTGYTVNPKQDGSSSGTGAQEFYRRTDQGSYRTVSAQLDQGNFGHSEEEILPADRRVQERCRSLLTVPEDCEDA